MFLRKWEQAACRVTLFIHGRGSRPRGLLNFIALSLKGGNRAHCGSVLTRGGIPARIRTDIVSYCARNLVGQTRSTRNSASLLESLQTARHDGFSLCVVCNTCCQALIDGGTAAHPTGGRSAAQAAAHYTGKSCCCVHTDAPLTHPHSAVQEQRSRTHGSSLLPSWRCLATWGRPPGAPARPAGSCGFLPYICQRVGSFSTSSPFPCSAPLSTANAARIADVARALPTSKAHLLDQRRYLPPNRWRNDYRRLGGKKKGRNIEVLPETIDLLTATREAEATTAVTPKGPDWLPYGARPGVPLTEAMDVPSVADVSAPLPIEGLWTPDESQSLHPPTATDRRCSQLHPDARSSQEQQAENSSIRSSGRLAKVALHVGDVSRLRVDATVFGASPCFKVQGSGRAFNGCSSLIAGAGPMLPMYLSQQRDAYIKARSLALARGGSATAAENAAVAVAALREGVARLVALASNGFEKPPFATAAPEEVGQLPAADLSFVAATAGRQLLAMRRGLSGSDIEAAPGARTRSVVAPASLLPPGAVMLSPGFHLPSGFLLHVVEPNAVYTSDHFFRALVRCEELEAARRLSGRASKLRASLQNGEDSWPAISDNTEKALFRGCWTRMRLLEDCYVNALEAAAALGVQSVAVPCLGAGVGGFPIYIAARCAAKAVGRWLKGQEVPQRKGGDEDAAADASARPAIERVVFCTTSDLEWKALRRLIPESFT